MSQILIDMEMPKSCLGSLDGYDDCPLVHKYNCKVFEETPYEVRKEIVWHNRLPNCPLKELSPHGRLIDADALISSTKDVYGEKELTGQRGTLHVPLGGVFKEYVDEAPTILDANT